MTETAHEAGFSVPVALTRAVWLDAVEWDEANPEPQDEAGRLWDVLWMAATAARTARRTSVVEFEVLRTASQNRNVKLRDIAAEIVTAVSGQPPPDTTRFA